MTFSFERVRALVLIQGREFHRDFGTLFLNIIFPVLFVFGLILADLANPTLKFKIGVVDVAGDHASQQFVQALTSSPGMEVTTLSLDRATAALREGEVHVVVVVRDSGFARDAGRIELVSGPRYEPFSRLLLDAVRDRMGRDAHDARIFEYQVKSPPGEVRSEFSFTFPGLLALAMVQLGLFATAVPLLQARDRGTLRYLSLTPLTLGELLVGQVAIRACVAMVQVTAILVAGSFMLDLSAAQWAQVFAVSTLGIVLLVSIGYAIAGMAVNPQAGTAMILIINFAMLLGGNIFLDPRDSTAQYLIACVLPISYLSDMYRQVITGESGVWSAWVDVLAILGFSLLAVVVALRTFRFDTDHNAAPQRRRTASLIRQRS